MAAWCAAQTATRGAISPSPSDTSLIPSPQRYRRPNRRADGVGRAEACHAAAGDDRGFRLLFEQRFDQHGFLVGAVERLAYHVAAREQTGGVCRNDALGIRFVI